MKTLRLLIHFTWIFLVLLQIVCVTQGTMVSTTYKGLQQGQNITGTVVTELTVRSKIQCSDRCLNDEKCYAHQYKETGQQNCILIYRNSTDPDRQIFEKDDNTWLYEKGWSGETSVMQSIWKGLDAVLYWSFDDSEGLVLMEGTQQKELVPLVSGKVNSALTFDHTQRQWVDLGVHTEACMIQPHTCGVAGGAISLWVQIEDCGGLISSQPNGRSGSAIYCSSSGIHFHIILPNDAIFSANYPKPLGWTHFLLNYLGPNYGIKMFFNGQQVASSIKISVPRSAGDGRLVVGRGYTNVKRASSYTSMHIDELTYFDQALSLEEIRTLYHSA